MRINTEKCGTAVFGVLSMGEIDQLSQMIGRIETTLEYQNKEISKVTEGIAVIKNTTDTLSKDNTILDISVKALHLRVDEMEPKVESHEDLIKKGKGILGFLSVIIGFIGWILSQFVFPWLARLMS